ncbi:hypothetical protein VitviT2T_024606 [Vitis vinifera]|uniref:Uncharacterized protein n=1 Tax=Vitis vinifera TaxID=29760 RepID=A0ABY9DI62_VITVI|nr:hypothetical protein VitviT2T_024606 [Vitis vinifera]
MGYWQLGPLFPAWLQTQKDQMDLDISRVSIKDDILSWFWSLNLDYINLADNRIYGTVPSLPTAYQIYLCSNKFTGPLPRISSKTFSLDLSHNSFNGSLSPILCQQNNEENILWSLDLSGNILSGELPDCWASWTLLMVLRSQNNILTGHLPSSMGSLLQLRSLHLHNNSLSGTLPPSMKGCKSLSFVDLSENEFSGSIPMWVGKNLSYAKYTRFASTKWLRNLHALKSSTSKSRRHFEGCFAAAKPPFGTQVPLRSVVRLFRSCEMGCENDAEIPLAAKTPSRYEIHASSLQKVPSAAKRNSDPWCPF